jgi:diguanylate cyclase (GGDEF)-like protein/PAS domain S-box-containing protein
MLDNIPIGIYRSTPGGAILYANFALVRMFGYADKESFFKENISTFFARRPDRSRWQRIMDRKGLVCDFEVRFRRRDGAEFWARDNGRTVKDAEGRVLYYEGSLEDVTARKRAEEAERASSSRYRSFIELTEQLGWVTNPDGEVEEDIPAWRKYTGQTFDEVRGVGWAKALHPDDAARAVEVWRSAVAAKSPYETEYRLRRQDGVYRHFIARGVPILRKEDGLIREWVGTCLDITERKRAEEELVRLSMTDSLTELYNRRGFIALADQQLKLSRRSKKGLLFFFADLDGLKGINDTLGHQEGDRALVETARLLRSSFRESDLVARVGGDEFAVLAVGTDGMEPSVLVDRLSQLVDSKNAKAGLGFEISLSLGLCFYEPDEGPSLDELMSRADRAMYEAKKGTGRGGVRYLVFPGALSSEGGPGRPGRKRAVGPAT